MKLLEFLTLHTPFSESRAHVFQGETGGRGVRARGGRGWRRRRDLDARVLQARGPVRGGPTLIGQAGLRQEPRGELMDGVGDAGFGMTGKVERKDAPTTPPIGFKP